MPSSPWPAPPTPWCAAARAVAATAVARIDLLAHEGAHPRLGVLDVVPFVPYEPGGPAPDDLSEAVVLRDDFARWLGAELGVPSFLYGPLPGGRARTLPDIRRHAFSGLAPDFGPARADPRTGATALGARRVLVAYNVWVSSPEVARTVAPLVRGTQVRALGLAVGRRAQVSCNLVDPLRVRAGPALRRRGRPGRRGRRVGGGGGAGRPRARGRAGRRRRGSAGPTLDLSEEATVEARLAGGAWGSRR